MLFSSITLKKRASRRSHRHEYYEDKALRRIRDEILNDKVPLSDKLANQAILAKLDENFRKGEISGELYQEIRQLFEYE